MATAAAGGDRWSMQARSQSHGALGRWKMLGEKAPKWVDDEQDSNPYEKPQIEKSSYLGLQTIKNFWLTPSVLLFA